MKNFLNSFVLTALLTVVFAMFFSTFCAAATSAKRAEPLPPPHAESAAKSESELESELESDLESDLESESSETTQLLRVVVPNPNGVDASVVGLTRENANASWREELPAARALIGRAGLAPIGEKKEGDGKTPAGEYRLGFVFGRDASPPEGLALPYRQATANDFWIDDPASSDYNRWVRGTEPTVSHERLLLEPESSAYDWALTIEYNVDPIVPGDGSAIFLHVYNSDRSSTSGCVSLEREDVLKILRWLDPAKNPRIRIETPTPDDSASATLP